MKLLLLGATGRTGAEILDLAVARGHEVTAFVRSPAKLTDAASVFVVAGDPLDAQALRAVVPGHEAVVSAFGHHGSAALRPSTLMSQLGRTLVEAMSATEVSRLVTVSAAVLFPLRGLAARVAGWVLRNHARDLRSMEDVIVQSPLAWTIVRPPRLVSGSNSHYSALSGALPPGGTTLSFRAVATCMLDEVEFGTHVRQVVGLAADRGQKRWMPSML